jgi:phosphohistidine phosphatase
MKTLSFIRHAKSSWKHNVIDQQRPLRTRGVKDAEVVSKLVAASMPVPNLIITSDAVRAKTTAHYFKEAYALKETNFIINTELYDFSGQQVMKVIKELDDTLDCVMLSGHNHAFTSIVNMLGSVIVENLPTCGFVAITFQIEQWSKISSGTTIRKIFPGDLK